MINHFFGPSSKVSESAFYRETTHFGDLYPKKDVGNACVCDKQTQNLLVGGTPRPCQTCPFLQIKDMDPLGPFHEFEAATGSSELSWTGRDLILVHGISSGLCATPSIGYQMDLSINSGTLRQSPGHPFLGNHH